MSEQVRVLIIDDSAFNRRSLKAMLESGNNIKVIGTATDG
jgi:chemotaxis response regulator CheB